MSLLQLNLIIYELYFNELIHFKKYTKYILRYCNFKICIKSR